MEVGGFMTVGSPGRMFKGYKVTSVNKVPEKISLSGGPLATSYLMFCLTLRSKFFPSVFLPGTRACPHFFTIEIATQMLTSLRYTDMDMYLHVTE